MLKFLQQPCAQQANQLHDYVNEAVNEVSLEGLSSVEVSNGRLGTAQHQLQVYPPELLVTVFDKVFFLR